MKVAVVCGMIVFGSISLLSKAIVELFIPTDSDAGVIAIGDLPIFSVCAVFFALNIACIGYCQSLGRAMRAMVYTLLRGVILLVPMFFLMSSVFPSWGMWGAIPVSEFLTIIVISVTLYPQSILKT